MIYFFGKVEKSSGLSFNQAGLSSADDMVSGQVLFSNGCLATGLWCFSVSKDQAKEACVIIGTEGSIAFSIFGEPVIEVTNKGKKEILRFDKLPHVQQPMISDVVQYFLDKAPNPCSGEDAVNVMRIIDSFTV
jgi:predicted dehydrogenase